MLLKCYIEHTRLLSSVCGGVRVRWTAWRKGKCACLCERQYNGTTGLVRWFQCHTHDFHAIPPAQAKWPVIYTLHVQPCPSCVIVVMTW